MDVRNNEQLFISVTFGENDRPRLMHEASLKPKHREQYTTLFAIRRRQYTRKARYKNILSGRIQAQTIVKLGWPRTSSLFIYSYTIECRPGIFI